MNVLLFTLVFTTVGYALLPIEKQKNIIDLIEAITKLIKVLKPPIDSSDSGDSDQDS